MSRNEMFLILACACAFAMLTAGPAPLLHPTQITLGSLFSPAAEPTTLFAETADFGQN